MTLNEIAETLHLEDLTPELGPPDPTEITGGHVSDLLSDVLANAPADGVLVTIQVHMNVVAVALHADLAAVIFAAGRRPDDAVKDRASREGIRLYVAADSAFDIAGRLYGLGLRGRAR